MNRRQFIKTASLAAASLAVPGCATFFQRQKPPTDRPNFVFFLIDDLGWMDLGCYGSTFYETPNIDKLARQGMRFTDAYAACPVCSPTRASIMTGKYPARIHLTDYIAGARKGMLLPADYLHYMKLEETTIAETLKDAGYKTFFCGKWHLGDRPYYPEKQGFAINVAGYHASLPPSYYWPYKNKRWKWNPAIENLDLDKGGKGEYLTDRLTDESLEFLDTVGGGPFLLYLSHYAVHTPLQAKKELEIKYKAKAAKLPDVNSKFKHAENQAYSAHEKAKTVRLVQDHPIYAAMVHSVDESVGRITKKLRQLGLAENTVVIFMSDNGGLSTAEGSPTSNVPLRAGKGWLYEGGIREPMFIKWPGGTKPGSICSEPVTSTDFYPTMLEMAGLSGKPEQHMDGISLVPLLKGQKSLDRKAIYWHYPHYSNQGGRPGGAVRAGDYKLIEYYEDSSIELFNLRSDPGERDDLSKKMPEKADELRAMLRAWRKSVDAKMPKPNPDYIDSGENTQF